MNDRFTVIDLASCTFRLKFLKYSNLKRQTYKNLLSAGSVQLEPNFLLKPAAVFKKADENVAKTLKTNTMATMSTQCLPGLLNSNAFSSSSTGFIVQSNARNALGDIGNRITAQSSSQPSTVISSKFLFFLFFEILSSFIKKKGLVKKTLTSEQIEMSISTAEDESAKPEQKSLNETSIMDVSEEITDIDEFDSDNPQLVSEYAKDIYNYLNNLEKQFRISPNFLQFKIVTPNMRAVLIDWLIQVHMKFHLLQETMYLCVQIIDAYLQVCPFRLYDISLFEFEFELIKYL